jgi:hypothetical protein
MALVIQHAKRARRIILSSVNCVALQYFLKHFLVSGATFAGGWGGGGRWGVVRERVFDREIVLRFLYNCYLKYVSL